MRYPIDAALAFLVALAVAGIVGYVDGDLWWGLLTGVIVGAVFALFILFGAFLRKNS